MTSPSTDRRYGLNADAAIKVPVLCATTANITLSGEQTIDGVLTSGSDVLVKNQSDQTTNGIYTSSTGTWTRRIDFDDNWDVVEGTQVFVVPGGGTNGGTYWYVTTTDNPIQIGTSNITFAQVVTLTYSEPTETTVASAATGADIWTPTGTIDWTGTATTTAFAAAAHAGQRRVLVCTGACSFTASANFEITGVGSGSTVTVTPTGIVTVVAVTTTHVHLDVSGTTVAPSSLLLTGGTMTGPINETMQTVISSASTSDIWGATASDVIDWTGTATTTGFPAAPVAGARRQLKCAAACKFTAGANLEILGVESGVTVTMNAGARVTILAKSTTTFQLEYSLSGTFTATMTGFASPPTKTWSYTVVNGVVNLTCLAMTSGTSNSDAITITGIPAQITPAATKYFMCDFVLDNNTFIYTATGTLDTGGGFTMYKDLLGTGFTASGVKNGFRYTQEITYRLGGNF